MTATTQITHHTVKDERGEITHYDLKVNGTQVGTATKGEKGKFNFKPANGAGTEVADIKTMRDLKVEVLRNLPKDFLPATATAAKPKKGKAAKKGGDPVEKEQAATAVPAEASEDINLDRSRPW